MGGGVVVWVVNLVQIGLAIALFRARAVGALCIYLAVAMVSVGAYLWGLNAGGSLSALVFRPFDALAFFVIGTGGSIVGLFVNGSFLGPILWLDFLVGLVLDGVILFAFAYFVALPREEKKRSLVLVSLILFGLLEQALIAYGRLPLGVSNAATGRYSTLTLIAPTAALIFLTLYADASRVARILAASTGLVMDSVHRYQRPERTQDRRRAPISREPPTEFRIEVTAFTRNSSPQRRPNRTAG